MNTLTQQHTLIKHAMNTVSEGDITVISEIVTRATEYADERGIEVDRLSLHLDLTVAHSKCRLDLEKLLSFPNFDFVHDVWGIHNELDRTTGSLGTFLPRCAR